MECASLDHNCDYISDRIMRVVLQAIYVGPRGETRDAELREAFDAIDADGSGEIVTEELTTAFNNYGSQFSAAEIVQIMGAVDKDNSGEIDFDEFKAMMSIGDANETPESKVLKKKARSVVRALIMQQRMKDAFASFDARYNFLRFSDASIIAPVDQKLVRLHEKKSVSQCLADMRADHAMWAPVYVDPECKASPAGFVDMMHIVLYMLAEFKLAFKLPATDPQAIQMRLDRISQSASNFSSTPISAVFDKAWTPIRPGYSVFDLGKVLAQGIKRVPYVAASGDLAYLIDQSSFIAAVDEDPKVAHAVTAICRRPAPPSPIDTPLITVITIITVITMIINR